MSLVDNYNDLLEDLKLVQKAIEENDPETANLLLDRMEVDIQQLKNGLEDFDDQGWQNSSLNC